MIELIPLYIPLLAIGFLIMMSSYFVQGSRLVLVLLFIGAAIAFSGVSFIPHPLLDFCEDNNGIYNSGLNMNLCSTPDEHGEYVVYKIIKVNDEFKLARFSEIRDMKGERKDG